jgi:hypothetical protein
MSSNTNSNPYEIAAALLAEMVREAGLANAVPAFVSLTSAILPDGSEVVIPLGPARSSLIDAVVDGYGKRGVIAIVMRDGGKQDDDGKSETETNPSGPEPEAAPRDLATVH